MSALGGHAPRSPVRALARTSPGLRRDHTRQSAPEAESMPPRVLHGPRDEVYLRFESLGHGATSQCYRVENLQRMSFAMKVLTQKTLRVEITRKNTAREIVINSHLHNLRIVEFRTHFFDDVNVYLCLELCVNGSLSQLIKSRKTLTQNEACYFMANIVLGIEYLHENLIVHRDIKPGNILLDRFMCPKIADFGLAVVVPSKAAVLTTFAGTPCYMAPELVRKPRRYTMKADVWSAGTVLYTMVFGRSPFRSKSLSTTYRRILSADFDIPVVRNASPLFCDLVRRILVVDADARPAWRDLLGHEWFRSYYVPGLPTSVLNRWYATFCVDSETRLRQLLASNPVPKFSAYGLYDEFVNRGLQD